jgi:pilus assembly protein CpaD
MAAFPDRRHVFAGRALSLGFAVAAAAALSACGVDYASTAPAFPGDFQERHPIVLASAPTSIDVFAVGGSLDTRSLDNIRAFAQRYRHYGSGDIAILAPAGTTANSNAVREVRAALARAGVNGGVRFGTYATPDRGAAAPIRLSFIGVQATVPTACGQWPEDLASGSSVEGWKNEPYSNFGCASQSVMAAQVDDPRDFVQPRALGPSDVEMRTRAIEAGRNGQDPGTQWKDTVLTPIGGSLSGGGQ